MDQDKYIALLYKKQQGNLDAMEKVLLEKWLSDAAINRTLAAKMEEDWQLTEKYEPSLDYDIDQEYTLLQDRIAADEKPSQVAAKVVDMPSNRRWMRWIAAASVIFIGIGVWFFTNQNTDEILVNSLYADKLEEVQLADGTRVWIKANSHFQYPEIFGTTRIVQLKGEALFEVAKNPAMPFIVETEEATVQVLGTVFNVRAIPNDKITEVIVKEGRVALSNKAQTKKVQLAANEKGVLQHATSQIDKDQEEDMNELAYQSKVLFFKSTPLLEVLKSLERLFDKKIEVSNLAINNCALSGRYSSPNLEEILKVIHREFNVKAEINGDTIFLTGKGCDKLSIEH